MITEELLKGTTLTRTLRTGEQVTLTSTASGWVATTDGPSHQKVWGPFLTLAMALDSMSVLEVGRDPETWIIMQDGARFWPLGPRPSEVRLQDVARALSRIPRFNGHTPRMYSVAEHSILVADLARSMVPTVPAVPAVMEVEDAEYLKAYVGLRALIHDASEAYLGDRVRPLRRGSVPGAVEFMEAECFCQAVIHEALLPRHPPGCSVATVDDLIREADNLALRYEMHAFFGSVNPAFVDPSLDAARVKTLQGESRNVEGVFCNWYEMFRSDLRNGNGR